MVNLFLTKGYENVTKLKRNNFIFLLLYALITTLGFWWLSNGYTFWDYRLVITLLIVWVTGISIIFDFNANNALFSQCIVFNGFALLYSCHFVISSVFDGLYISNNIYYLQFLALVSILSFNIAYLCFPRLQYFQKVNFTQYSFKVVRYASFALFLLSVFAEFYVVFRQIGLNTILSNARATTSLLMSDYSAFAFYRYTFPLLAGIFLLLYYNRKQKIDLLLFLTALSFSVFNALIYLSRTYMLAVLMPLGFLSEHYKKISRRVLLIAILFIFLLFGIWKSMFSTQTVLTYSSEFGTWFRIGENILSDSSVSLRWGESYFNTLLNLIIPVTNIESLSNWYVRTYEYSTYLIGGGRGFSGIIEAYINFGIVGNIFIFMVLGFIFKQINKNSNFNIILYVIFLLSVYQIFRSDSYSMWKNMMWFKIYPTLLIFMLAKKLK